MTKTKSTPKTLQELKKEKGKTNWAKVFAEKESSNRVAGGI